MALAVYFAFLPTAQALDVVVTTTADNGAGSLRQAIEDVNNSADLANTITLQLVGSTTITLGSALQPIGNNVVIDGTGATISGNGADRIFFVASGNVALKNFTLQDGLAQGGNGGNADTAGGGGGGLGAGGAVFVNSAAVVTLEQVQFVNNAAAGGAGGTASIGSGNRLGGGGGGGLGGNGGDVLVGSTINGGGGGGGLHGNGGSSAGFSNAGSGGGGETADGNPGSNNTGGTAGSPGGDFGGGGGGGGGNNGGNGGAGGFGGGSGGAGLSGNEATPGFGGGEGGATYVGGGGGSAFGGAVFVRAGGSLTIVDSTFNGGQLTAGTGGTAISTTGANGQAAASGVYIMSGTALNYSVITTAGSITLADTIAGAGALEKLGDGALLLTGNNTYTGGTTVSAGRLAVNNGLLGNVTVSTAGVLGGTGGITGDLFNQGIVAPGNSIGTLTLTGNYVQSAGSSLEIEINDAGQTDVLNVLGNVTLSGTVDVKAAPGAYANNASYTFLTYTGSLTGTFSGITDDLAFFNAVMFQNGQNLGFTLQAVNNITFASLAATPNQLAVGTVFDGGFAGLQPLTDEMMLMNTTQVRQSLDQLSGEAYGTGAYLQFQNTTNQMQLLA